MYMHDVGGIRRHDIPAVNPRSESMQTWECWFTAVISTSEESSMKADGFHSGTDCLRKPSASDSHAESSPSITSTLVSGGR